MSDGVFPEGFLWGTATSSHQVEGNNTHNDWWAWEQAKKVRESSGLACEHYQRFEQDFDIAVRLSHKAHRFSIEWSRIEPQEDCWSDEALEHYVKVIQALRDRHLEPIVTLHHFTTPQWLAAQGGWVNPKSVDCFARYTQRVISVLGPQVRYWITINEPMVYVNMHYVEGVGPPGAHDLKQALRVTEHLIRAHAAAYRILHESFQEGNFHPQVSVAKHVPVFTPCRSHWPIDRWVTAYTDRIFNQAFLDALMEGCWFVPGIARLKIPEAQGTLDFLGVNFYGRQFIRWGPSPGRWFGSSCDLGHHPREVTERTAMGWDVHPASFHATLSRWARLGLALLVTENGTAMVDDHRRWSFITRHLQAMAQAIQEGARVIGYCYWSLLDNFEWAHGYGPRFGLVDVDYSTQQRRIRQSAWRYAEVCRTNRLVQEQ